MDRLDLWISVSKVDYDRLSLTTNDSENSETIKSRVTAARSIAAARYARFGSNKKLNAEMTADDIDKCITLSDVARQKLKEVASRLSLSGRGFHRVIKVAQTIADLGDSPRVEIVHILEALQYRQKMD